MAADYYQTLGVPRTATEKDIKSAYRRLARQYHPDVNQGDRNAETRFKEINEAYSVLGDPEKRAKYDQFGADWEHYTRGPSGPGPNAWPGGARGFGGAADFGDLFETLFSTQRRRSQARPRGPSRGGNIEYTLEVPLREAVFGATKTVNVEIDDACSQCQGTGHLFERCRACGGTGQAPGGAGVFGMIAVCNECRGEGEVPRGKCDACRGSGRVHRSRQLEVKVPAGIDDGQRIRLAGEGLAGVGGGPRGDLHLVVKVTPNGFFERRGNDLICEVPVTFAEAALGAEITVPTKDGTATLKVPPGTQSGQVLRLAGMGVPRLRDKGAGDQLVRIKVTVPKRLSRQQRELIEALAGSSHEDPRAKLNQYRF